MQRRTRGALALLAAMLKMADPANLPDALQLILPLVGGGGVTAIIVAWLGRKNAKESPNQPQVPQQLGIQALLADHMAMTNFTMELKRLSDAMEDAVRLGNRVCDLIDITNAVERLQMKQRKNERRGD